MEKDGIIQQTYLYHKAKVSKWEHGKPIKAWLDNDNILCIKYEDGMWYHYDNGKWW